MMNKAVFLDRDGVLNRERGNYVFRREDFIINEGVMEALKILQEKEYLLIVISNQSGIAKGIYTYNDVAVLHRYMEELFRKNGIFLTAVYYCPHHPAYSHCLCRKPDSLMLEKAIARFQINPSLSYFIGDADRDVEAGKKAGVKTIKVEPNTSLMDVLKKYRL